MNNRGGIPFEFTERKIVGGSTNFLEVTHLKMKGSNFKIGEKLGEMARTRHGVAKIPWTDPRKTHVQKNFMKQNYPIHYERMLGAASAYGMDINSDDVDFSALYYYMGVPGCTAVYYPPSATECGSGILSRNFDFTTGTVMGMPPGKNEMAAVSRPYIIEVYPDQGYPSLYICSFDLLGGVLDGINAEGLTVTIMADDESPRQYTAEPMLGSGVGIHELLIMRMLLDQCANVEEAEELLLMMKQYYVLAPLHYLIADRFGHSFVWERSYTGNKEHIIQGDGRPQVATNFLLHRYASINDLPREDEMSGRMYSRYRTVQQAIEQMADPYTMEDIRRINSLVFWKDGILRPSEAPNRTLWHSIYNTTERSLEVSFYLRDSWNAENIEEKSVLRSEYFRFQISD